MLRYIVIGAIFLAARQYAQKNGPRLMDLAPSIKPYRWSNSQGNNEGTHPLWI